MLKGLNLKCNIHTKRGRYDVYEKRKGEKFFLLV